MRLNEISDNAGAPRPRKRRGRGIGSGLGKTSGKGHKGQKARSGGAAFRRLRGWPDAALPASAEARLQEPVPAGVRDRQFGRRFRRRSRRVASMSRSPVDEAAMQAAGLYSKAPRRCSAAGEGRTHRSPANSGYGCFEGGDRVGGKGGRPCGLRQAACADVVRSRAPAATQPA